MSFALSINRALFFAIKATLPLLPPIGALGAINPSTPYTKIRNDIQGVFLHLKIDLEERQVSEEEQVLSYLPLAIAVKLTLEAENVLPEGLDFDENTLKTLESQVSVATFSAIERQVIGTIDSPKKPIFQAHFSHAQTFVDLIGVDAYLRSIYEKYYFYFDKIKSPYYTYFAP